MTRCRKLGRLVRALFHLFLPLVSLLVAAFGSSASAREKGLPLKIKNELKKKALALTRAKTEEAADELFPYLFVHGRKGVEYLGTLRGKPGHADWIDRVTSSASTTLGLDLCHRKVESVPDHMPSFFALEEIVLVRSGDQFAGFSVASDSRLDDGVVTVRWWSQKGKVKKLDQAGGERGTLEVKGVESSSTMMPNTGYVERDFSFDLEGMPISFHFVGPAYFCCRYPGQGFSLALTGKSKPRSLSSSDETIHFDPGYPRELAQVEKNLEDYLFRTIPGCERLPLEGDEIEQFSQYEMVQVQLRQTRPEGQPVVLVKFLELSRIGFAPYHYDYIVGFVNEILEVDADRVLVMSGSAPGLEGNLFFQKGKWARPSSRMVKTLRVSFPETY